MVTHVTDDFASANPVDIQKYELTELEIKIENALKKGELNAIKMRELKLKLGVKNERKIRLAIESMRLKRIIVLSSSKGYWISDDLKEYQKWDRYMTSYIADLAHVKKVVGEAVADKHEKNFQVPLFLS